jgi:pyruvate dehydrogenase E2 component (dihydrolipoamide acetyltransferase)
VNAAGAKGETNLVQPTAAERAVARRAAESRATVPHLELSVPTNGPGPVDSARLLRACALALTEHPRANAAYRDGQFELYSRVNIGLVLALPEAYVIPTVLDADSRTVGELAQAIEELRADALAGRLAPPSLSGATFTVWNAGQHGIAQAGLPVVPPQAAALAAGTEKLTLSCDHRILYGAPAAGFLSAVSRRLEEDPD